MQLAGEREASEPRNQFSAQVEEERRRMWNADPSTSWRELRLADLYTFREEASEIVKKRWVEQGIWNNKWNRFASGRWKHEEPLALDPELETNSEEESSPPLFSLFARGPEPKPRRSKSNDERRQIAERRVTREREREASRPYHQFVYQISKEREQIQDDFRGGEGTSMDLPDINTKAYENVKNTWIKRRIWNEIWGTLPGMSWKHEEPLEETTEGLTPQANPLENGCHEAGEAPFRNILGRPDTNTSESGIFTRNPAPIELDSAVLGNGNAEHPPSAPSSPRPRRGKQILRPTTGQASRPSRGKQSQKDEQSQPGASAFLRPVHSSKVSKAVGKRKSLRQPRLDIPQEVSSGELPSFSSMDATEPHPPEDHITPRRSKRIQKTGPSTAKDPVKTASTDPSTCAVRPKAERKVTSNLTTRSSAKRQGVSKRQSAKTARGKLGKE